ncbi:MAG: TRAP transporter permease [Chloroflexi bacterium]|nr:MAG: TRAP transporter permease [Chloroflexota bacterium]
MLNGQSPYAGRLSGRLLGSVAGLDEELGVAAKYRPVKGVPRWLLVILTTIGIGVSVCYIFRFTFGGLMVTQFGYHYLLIALFLPLAFLMIPATKGTAASKIPWYDILLAVLAFGVPFYLFLRANDILWYGWSARAPIEGLVTGMIIWLLPVEAARRAGGLPIALIALIMSFYPVFAGHMPGFLVGPTMSLERLISYHGFSTESIQGIPMQAFGRIIVGYLVFASALVATGGGQFFLNFALALLGHVRGGAAKVAVASSALFGTLTGASVVNVITTGSVTIPAMKKTGYPPYYAGAIEACASTGGILMPPVMGAVAFIMADFLGMPYTTIVRAAIIPSVLYFAALYFQADFFAAKTGLRGLPRSELPSLRQTLKQGWFYIFALAVLVFFLFYIRVETVAPFYATGALFAASLFRKETRPNLHRLVEFLEKSGTTLMEMVSILVPIGLVLGSLAITGLAYSLSSELVSIAGGSLPVLLLLGAVASYIMGMGATITACYVFLALVFAPVLIDVGVNPLAAHLFVMYCGMLSSITPPVALASYVAASVAGAPFMQTAAQAMRLGIMLFLIPFFFVLAPEFILEGSSLRSLLVISTAILGIVLASGGLEGYMWRLGKLVPIVRVIFLTAGVLLFLPYTWGDYWGIGIALLIAIGFWIVRRRSIPPAAVGASAL